MNSLCQFCLDSNQNCNVVTYRHALADAVGLHRVWERAVDVMASDVAPVR